MNYWWVNHKQTFNKEFKGGYIWSPTKNKNGSRNQSYLNLTLVNVGDIVYSFSNALIKAIGFVESGVENRSVPEEFGAIGKKWNKEGYLVKIKWLKLESYFKPKDNINLIEKFLPKKYSPIQKSGNGNQGIYLASLDKKLSDELLALISFKNPNIKLDLKEISNTLNKKIVTSYIIPSEEALEFNDEGIYSSSGKDERQTIKIQIKARRGQAKFRNDLRKRFGNKCVVTGCEILDILEAAHINPYRGGEDNNPKNGLLLRADIHTLFDLNLIGIEPETLKIHIHKKIKSQYSDFHLRPLLIIGLKKPSNEAISTRWEEFKARMEKD
jgi:putative restriction endonuclease